MIFNGKLTESLRFRDMGWFLELLKNPGVVRNDRTSMNADDLEDMKTKILPESNKIGLLYEDW